MASKVSISHLALSDAQVRELINAIRANPVLYRKASSAYKDKQQKLEAWNALTSTLSFDITGPQAALKFKYLRDSMSREIKKGREINPGRSGQGVVDGPPNYKSSWPFFNDLLFLTDHISPKSDTCSTYLRLGNCAESPSGSSSTGAGVFRGAFPPSRGSSSTGTDNSTSQDGMSRSSTPVTGDTDSSDHFIPHFLDVSAASNSEENITLRQKAMAYQMKAPAPDMKRKQKRNRTDGSNDSELETKISRLHSLGETLKSQFTKSESQTNSALSSIQFALDFVPKEMQLQCIMEMMAVAQKYSRMSREEFYSTERSPTSPLCTSPSFGTVPTHHDSAANLFFPQTSTSFARDAPSNTPTSTIVTEPTPLKMTHAPSSQPNESVLQPILFPHPSQNMLPKRIVVSSDTQISPLQSAPISKTNCVSSQPLTQSSTSKPVITMPLQLSRGAFPKPALLSQQNIQMIPVKPTTIVRIPAAALASFTKMNDSASPLNSGNS